MDNKKSTIKENSENFWNEESYSFQGSGSLQETLKSALKNSQELKFSGSCISIATSQDFNSLENQKFLKLRKMSLHDKAENLRGEVDRKISRRKLI